MKVFVVLNCEDEKSGCIEIVSHFSTIKKAHSAMLEMIKGNHLYIGGCVLRIQEYEMDFYEKTDCTGAIIHTIDMR